MSLSNLDRDLVRACLQGDAVAWRTFCERFAGLITRVVEQTARLFEVDIDKPTTNELVSEVFSSIVDRNFNLLQRFRGESSLATYLTIVARRVVVRKIQGAKVHVSKSNSEVLSHALPGDILEHRLDPQSSQSPSASTSSTSMPVGRIQP
ncbi:MAG: hypothetical protein FJ308_01235 [Planctomycetes bacterium]|nr:hypothetical protein [Planctomycetota bacterium]